MAKNRPSVRPSSSSSSTALSRLRVSTRPSSSDSTEESTFFRAKLNASLIRGIRLEAALSKSYTESTSLTAFSLFSSVNSLFSLRKSREALMSCSATSPNLWTSNSDKILGKRVMEMTRLRITRTGHLSLSDRKKSSSTAALFPLKGASFSAFAGGFPFAKGFILSLSGIFSLVYPSVASICDIVFDDRHKPNVLARSILDTGC